MKYLPSILLFLSLPCGLAVNYFVDFELGLVVMLVILFLAALIDFKVRDYSEAQI